MHHNAAPTEESGASLPVLQLDGDAAGEHLRPHPVPLGALLPRAASSRSSSSRARDLRARRSEPHGGWGRTSRSLGTTPVGEGLVVAIIPAHNEERQIGEAITSLRQQESPPDLIVVCADNCTDGTAARAEAAGAQVFATVGNLHKKAGALNQALEVLLPELGDADAVLVMDADSILAPGFIAEGRRDLREGVGGVGGTFTGRRGGGYADACSATSTPGTRATSRV